MTYVISRQERSMQPASVTTKPAMALNQSKGTRFTGGWVITIMGSVHGKYRVQTTIARLAIIVTM